MKFKREIIILFAMLCLVLSVTIPVEGKSRVPDYSLTSRNKIPAQYKWKIEDIYPSVIEWKSDKVEFSIMVPELFKRAKGWTTSADTMLKFLKLRDKTYMKGYRLYSYASNRSNMDMGNPKYQKMKGELRTLFVKLGSGLSFFDSDVLKLGEEGFAKFKKKNPGLKEYDFEIVEILRMKDHVLPPSQQRIVSLTGLFSGVPGKASNILNNVEMPNTKVTFSDGRSVELNYANYAYYRKSKNSNDRRLAMRSFWGNHKKFEKTFSVLLDGALKQHLFSAKVGKFKNTLEAALFPNSIDVSVYTNLIKNVRENLGTLHRYLKLKKELLNLKVYKYDDIYASSVPKVDKTYEFREAKNLVLKAMEPMGKEYISGLKTAFSNRWIDIYPNKGKQSGAYSSGVYGIHPYVKLNFAGYYDNVSTLAHELGHAMHSWFAQKKQSFANSNYATFLAEIASTFNENMLMSYLLKHEKDDLFKLFLLDEYLERVRGTLYRQTLFSEFELAMHQLVESGGTLTADWLDKKYLALTRLYYGHDKGVVIVDDFIANEWAGIPHFYYNYYVYTYSTGIVASMALAENVLNGNNPKVNRNKYIDFLSAGGSRPPLEILKKAGVDMTTSKPYKLAFKRLNGLVSRMESIVKSLKKKKKI